MRCCQRCCKDFDPDKVWMKVCSTCYKRKKKVDQLYEDIDTGKLKYKRKHYPKKTTTINT